MKSSEIRQSFLDYFKKHGHEVVRSSPLVPQNDPTLLFTNAGMVQFKDVFTGAEARVQRRATSSQKCVRAGGKHNDLENVGRTARHHTFFEMLGNFSFGDYFKEGAIALAWQWLTEGLKLNPDRLVITVFGGDASLGLGANAEARAIWRKVTGFGADRIFGLGMKDNFWMMGDTGPQGPCSEIHYWVGSAPPDPKTFGEEPAPDGTGWMEIWNLVFMQFEKKTKDSPLQPLPKPSIDTGAGLERVTAVVQGVKSNYDTDLLRPLVEGAGKMAGKSYGATMGDDDVSMRVLADHARAATFLIADGVQPSNEGRGYVLRRIMRRAIRHGVRLGLAEGDYGKLCAQVIATMGTHFPELRDAAGLIARQVDAEDQSFRRTIDRGMKLLNDVFAEMTSGFVLDGAVAFTLYDTYGFPVDLTRTIAEERGYSVDEAGFEREMEKQRARSTDFAGTGQEAVADKYKSLLLSHGATKFLGYSATEAEANIVAVELNERSVEIIADSTPFYGESGGQVGDLGRIEGKDFTVEITDTKKPGGDLIVHVGRVLSGKPVAGPARFIVDAAKRDATRRNHSATHLLHWALRNVLGDHVTQKGSLVGPERLRFDFSHFQPMTEDEKRRVEDLVNLEVLRNHESRVDETSFDEARKLGAMALFGEKYGDRVRVMRIGGQSVELCGGTHVARSGDIGLFKIVQETGIAQGIRRLEAQTGEGAIAYVRRIEDELTQAAERTRSPLFQVAAQVERLQRDLKDRERKIEELQRKLASGGGKDLLADAREVNGVHVLSARADVGDPKALRDVADQLRAKIKSGIVVLGGVGEGGKVSLVAAVTPDLTAKYQAGKIIAAISATVGGKGGGKADLAQGGGTDASKLDEALESVYKLLS